MATRCGDCGQRPYVGSRCWRCYVRYLGRYYGVSHYLWWSEHFNIIEAALRGRYEIIRLYQEPGPVDSMFKLIWKRDPKPMWATHKSNAKSKGSVLKIIAAVERRARGEVKNAPDNRTEEG